jgi:hypothetical protein
MSDTGDAIEVTGKESGGHYREVVDPKTGKVLAARIYKL